MRAELDQALAAMEARIDEMRAYLDVAGKRARLGEYEAKAAEPGIWDDRDRAQALMQKISTLQAGIGKFQSILGHLEDARALAELADEEDDADAIRECFDRLRELDQAVGVIELENLLSGPYDSSNAIMAIHPGAGGTESQDWAEMLLRMYTRWAERSRYRVELVDLLPGEEAGIKSATMIVSGENAFGYLKTEKGVHRLVRISPFDASARRHTSFASVDVVPEMGEGEIDIDPMDLKIDTYRSGGAGGQHVNKTDSAVRITHIPTGIIVQCQNERSQHSNKETAMKILRARLGEKQRQDQEKELSAIRGEQHEIAWGSQIRSYVFQPYTMVKDHRTDAETGNVGAVMDGAIDQFIEAQLRASAAAASASRNRE
ncbi:MAG: peptide chain release factor 2 [Clostridia bacterium]|nr:peptide chain release factor 2 [Clostridia bacterium]